MLATNRPPNTTAMAIALERTFLMIPLDTERSRLNDALAADVRYFQNVEDSQDER